MAPDPKKLEIAEIVCGQFFQGKGTMRHPLLVKVRDGALIDQMESYTLLRAEENRTLYFPTFGTFALRHDDDPKLHDAMLGIIQAIHTIKNLFEVEGPNVLYQPEQLLRAIKERYDNFDIRIASLGLNLIDYPPFNAVGSYGRTENHLELKLLAASERILVADDPNSLVKRAIDQARANAEELATRQGRALAVTTIPSNTQEPKKKRQQSWLPFGWTDPELISEGGQGKTYKVRRITEPQGAVFVFKRIKNPKRADRFESEIQALKKLAHPGILRIEEHGIHDGLPFYISEFCQNGDLSKRDLDGLSILEKLRLFRQICSAVAAAHEARIIHRDLKPSNILVRGNGTIAVGDFGLCIQLGAEDRLTETGEAVGPRNFMAPELEDGRLDQVTPAADVYSLGKVLYFLFTGRSFSREKHREPPYDLTLPSSGLAQPGMDFAYELLDNTIVQDSTKRLKDASQIVSATDLIIRKIELNANVLDMRVPQHCIYCVEGEYRVMQRRDTYSMILVCFKCGNIQNFQPPHNGWPNWWIRS